jgi:hypothetical protein
LKGGKKVVCTLSLKVNFPLWKTKNRKEKQNIMALGRNWVVLFALGMDDLVDY